MKIKLFIPGEPKPKQSARFRIAGKNGAKQFIQKYQSAEVKNDENNIRVSVTNQLPENFIPFSNPVRVCKLHYIFPPLSNFPKRKLDILGRQAAAMQSKNHISLAPEEDYIFKSTKPDLTDNLNKGLFDALEGIIFHNDSQVCDMQDVKKYYGLKPGIIIELEEIIV